MNFSTITFHGKEYPTFEVEVNGMIETCSVDTLCTELFKDDCDYEYVDDEAMLIDSGITFYVEEKDLKLSDEKLIELVRKNIS